MIDFPATPTLNQIFTAAGASWKYDGAKWISYSAGGDITAVIAGSGLSGGGTVGDVTLSLTPPVSVANGGTGAATGSAGPYLPLTGGSLSGSLTVANSLTVTAGNLNLNAGIIIHGVSYAYADANGYNYLYDNSGAQSIILGKPSGDNCNYHRQQTHWFQSVGAAVNYCEFSGSYCFNLDALWHVFSQRDLKQDIVPYERGLDAIVKLEPIRFRYKPGTPFAPKDMPSDPVIGLVAEDVLPHLPEMVGEHVTRKDMGELEQTYRTLAPGLLVFALINAVKELSARLEAAGL